MLLASPSSVYQFIMEYENGVVRGRGDEPYWHDVYTGSKTWNQSEVEERGLSFSNFLRILNAPFKHPTVSDVLEHAKAKGIANDKESGGCHEKARSFQEK